MPHPPCPPTRRRWLAQAASIALPVAATPLSAQPTAPGTKADTFWRMAREGGCVLLMRHTSTVPGLGDPPGFQLGNCATQRNLSEQGREEARQMGQRFVQEGVQLQAVFSSAWCRCTDTAALAFDPHYPKHRVWPALNSFFQGQGDGTQQTQAVLNDARKLSQPHNWMLVTHQVNMTALTDAYPAMGEVFLTRWQERAQRLQLLARWQP